jgi:hypothetical protein
VVSLGLMQLLDYEEKVSCELRGLGLVRIWRMIDNGPAPGFLKTENIQCSRFLQDSSSKNILWKLVEVAA